MVLLYFESDVGRCEVKKRKIGYIVLIILILPILIVNLTLIIKTRLFPDKIADFMGYKPFIVLSGSMETSINVGDLVIVRETNVNEIKENDIIAFKNEDIVITHRVKKILTSNGNVSFKTKGDNNNTEDDFIVNADEVEGIYVTKIPELGNVLIFFSKPIGMVVAILFIIVVAGGLYFITFKPSKNDQELLREFEEYKRKKESNK